jgi:hypothetical protein
MKPYIGMIVHFNEIAQKKPWPAIIIAIHEDEASALKGLVDVHVFSTISGGIHIARKIEHSDKPKEKEQTWSVIPHQKEEVNQKPAQPDKFASHKGNK